MTVVNFNVKLSAASVCRVVNVSDSVLIWKSQCNSVVYFGRCDENIGLLFGDSYMIVSPPCVKICHALGKDCFNTLSL